MRTHTAVSVACLFVLAALVPFGANGQGGDPSSTCELDGVHCCGDLELVFLNPDLKPRSDGKIHAQGSFFAQFQAIGADADKIKTFAFSFGADSGVEFDEQVCDLPVPFSGQQLYFYRADQNPDDGFFINLQTDLVPDGDYTAAVHAYDENDEELARFWARAVVDNCDDAPGVSKCTGNPSQINAHDQTMPWPIVLPGDGQLPEGEIGFTIEFAEKLHPDTPVTVYLNNEDITDQLEDWDGRQWDNDYFLGYYPYGLNDVLPTDCGENPAGNCATLGPAYKWTVRELDADDVLRVEGLDDSLNIATKDIHVGSGVTGGAISDLIPILTWQFDKIAAEVDLMSGINPVFKATLTNSGGAEGHPFAQTEGPEGWEFEWNPPHKPVPPGASTEQELTIIVPQTEKPGQYQVNATMEYSQAGQDKELRQVVTITVLGDVVEEDPDLQKSGDDDKKKSPGIGLVVLLAAVFAAVAVLRRRR